MGDEAYAEPEGIDDRALDEGKCYVDVSCSWC
jgi:hypothetical protein